ncbi:arylsulfatase A-like enzyme [Rhabdobacter roseus]|uniref:Arylsulfatase A-like enzyme n=1 Tax=Rhabdobacter roseus TaxID=1655419 RepID=A0A840TYN1_9BACT|nr:sulfatase-like hydrolase/transferase [Rhabdobacter roseus]MBB5286403.1 arylsulfatase A-like enzyme [Rhabdobacter roseus]
MKCIVLVATFGLALLGSLSPVRAQSSPKKPPHVVIIMADQLRYDALGEWTPNINQLKAEGVSFNRTYCASPLCVPSRGAFFTGLYPNETGSLTNGLEATERQHGEVKKGIPNLYQVLETKWDSWQTGKQHFMTEDKQHDSPNTKTTWLSLDKGYNAYLKANGKDRPGGGGFREDYPEQMKDRSIIRPYSTPQTGMYEPGFDFFFDGYILKTSLEALKKRDTQKPFLLNAMFLAPHPPLEIPEPYFSRVKNVQLPENVGKWSKRQSPLQLYNIPGYLGNRYTRDDWAKIWPVYLGLVNLLDDAVGQLVAELKRQGMYDNTIIVFTADHGEMLGSHRMWQKMCMYEESARVPLIIKFPKDYTPQVRETNELVSHIDVFPTLCEYLKVPLLRPVSGRSLLPLVQGQKPGRQQVFVQYDGNAALGNYQRCVIENGYKLVVDRFKNEQYMELYHLAEDPQEMTNLAFEPQYRDRVLALLGQLEKHMTATGDRLSLSPADYTKFLDDYKEYRR